MRRPLLLGLLIAAMTLALYWPAAHFDLIYFDDPVFVTETPEINAGLTWPSVVFAFTTLLAANWHPITNLTFLLTHQFAAPNPGLEHLVNATLHATNAALLFWLLFRLTRSPWRSAAAAALFAWHPLRVESVAWIAERKDVLSLFFFLLSLLAYTSYAERRKSPTKSAKPFLILTLVLFLLGLMSKSMLVTTPLVLLLIDLWPLHRVPLDNEAEQPVSLSKSIRPLIWEKWPFFALTLVVCALTYLSQQHGAMVSLDRIDPLTRLENVVASYLRYLGKTIWPQDLALLYPFPHDSHAYLALWPDWQLLAAALAQILITVLGVRRWRVQPYLLVGWLWLLVTLLPVIGLVQVGGQGMADRYTYLPLIGPVIAAVWLTADLFTARLRNLVLIPLTSCALLGCLWTTHQQLNYWRNTTDLFYHTLAVTGDNALAALILGDGLDHAGYPSAALVNYRLAAKLAPDNKQSYQEIARVSFNRADYSTAIENFRQVLALDPHEITAYLGLAQSLAQTGDIAGEITTLKSAAQIFPDSPEILNNLAWLLATASDPQLRDGALAVQLAGHANDLTHHQQVLIVGTLAAAYAENGRFNDAVSTATTACQMAAQNGDKALQAKNQELLNLYQKQQPFHEPEKLVPGQK